MLLAVAGKRVTYRLTTARKLCKEKGGKGIKQMDVVTGLRSQSTWKLLALSLATLGIYTGHYVKNQTNKLNAIPNESGQINLQFVFGVLVFSYVTAAMDFWSFFADDENPVNLLSSVLDVIWAFSMIIWGHKARTIMHRSLSAAKGSGAWFHAGWTFFFSPLYFNYKINVLSENLQDH
ncbi:MAG: hypothetical protein JWR21_1253 [Herminiimonas sp.]|nr:hypothetical protein [Herminiimonas sp.]